MFYRDSFMEISFNEQAGSYIYCDRGHNYITMSKCFAEYLIRKLYRNKIEAYDTISIYNKMITKII
jgi:hypothetical protein